MRRSVAICALAIIGAATFSSPAIAQRFSGGINSTQAQLEARITAGLRSGRLTPREASRLRAKLNQIERMEARMRASGNRLTFRERQVLNQRLNRLAAEIRRELNDYDRRFAGRRGGGWR